MPSLTDFRQQYPGAYDAVPDDVLAGALYQKFYADKLPRDQFDKQIGFSAPTPAPQFDAMGNPTGAVASPMPAPSMPYGEQIKNAASTLGGAIDSGVRATARGIPVVGSYLDELNAATNAAIGQGDYASNVASERARDKAFDAAHPVLSPALQIGGSALGASGLIAGAPKAAAAILGLGGKSMPAKMAAGALSGAGLGAVSGFGEGEGGLTDRAKSAVSPMLVGGALGAAAAPVGAAVGYMLSGPERAAQRAAIPTADELKQRSHALYKAAHDEGLAVSQPSWQAAVDEINTKAWNAGIDHTLHPDATAALGRLQRSAVNPQTLQDLDIMRQVVGDAAGSPKRGDRRVAVGIKNAIDDYLTNLSPKDVIGGDPSKAVPAITEARDLWSRASKSDMLTAALEKARRQTEATGSGGNIDNKIRQAVAGIVNNPAKARGLTEAEIAAADNVISGGGMGQNALRLVGKLSPSGNGLMAALGAGSIMHNPASAPVPIIGALAKWMADRATSRNVEKLGEVIRAGGSIPPLANQAERQMLIRALAQSANPTMTKEIKKAVPALR